MVQGQKRQNNTSFSEKRNARLRCITFSFLYAINHLVTPSNLSLDCLVECDPQVRNHWPQLPNSHRETWIDRVEVAQGYPERSGTSVSNNSVVIATEGRPSSLTKKKSNYVKVLPKRHWNENAVTHQRACWRHAKHG